MEEAYGENEIGVGMCVNTTTTKHKNNATHSNSTTRLVFGGGEVCVDLNWLVVLVECGRN